MRATLLRLRRVGRAAAFVRFTVLPARGASAGPGVRLVARVIRARCGGGGKGRARPRRANCERSADHTSVPRFSDDVGGDRWMEVVRWAMVELTVDIGVLGGFVCFLG